MAKISNDPPTATRIRDSGGDYIICPYCKTNWMVTHIPENKMMWDPAQKRFRMADMTQFHCNICNKTFDLRPTTGSSVR